MEFFPLDLFLPRLPSVTVYTHTKSLNNSLTSCTVMREILHRPAPQFPQLQNVGINRTCLVGLWQRFHRSMFVTGLEECLAHHPRYKSVLNE